jgi:hypothetical protein
MAKYPIRLFAIVMLLSMLSGGQIARAADEPVATAPIPPPPAAPFAAAPHAPAPGAPKASAVETPPGAPKASVAPTAPPAPKAIGGIANPARPLSPAALSAGAPSAAAPKATAAPKPSGGIAGPAKPPSLAASEASKRTLRPPELPRSEPANRTAAQKPSRAAKHERHPLFARAYPPPAAMRPRYYYPGAPVFNPDNDRPPFPPPWYDRGRPLAGYPGPGPRGPW